MGPRDLGIGMRPRREEPAGGANAEELPLSPLKRLQRAAGNAAMGRLVDAVRANASPEREQLPSGAGKPLESTARERLEQSYDTDLSDVRVHDDAAAHDFVSSRGAEAVTISHDIFLRRDAASRPTYEHLLAHETAHVVQQRSGTPSRIESVGEYVRLERDADASAAHAVAGGTASPSPGGIGEQAQEQQPSQEAVVRASAARSLALAVHMVTPELRDALAGDPAVYDPTLRVLIKRDADWITDWILELHVDDEEEETIVRTIRRWALTPKLDGGNYLDDLLDAIRGYRYQFDYGVSESAWGNMLDKLYSELEDERYTEFLFLVDTYSERYRGYRGRGGFGRWGGIQTAVMPAYLRDQISELNGRLAGRMTVPMTAEEIAEINSLYAQLRSRTWGLIDMPDITVAPQEGQQAGVLAAPVIGIAAILYALLLAIMISIAIGLIIAILLKIRQALDKADAEPWRPVTPPWQPAPRPAPPPGQPAPQPQPVPAPRPTPQPEPVPTPRPAPRPDLARPPAPGPQRTPDPAPRPRWWEKFDPFPIPRSDEEERRRRQRVEVILRLPSVKAIHLSYYRGLLGRLVHDILYTREVDAQAGEWDRGMNPRSPEGMYQEVYDRGVRMGLRESRIFRPNWSRNDRWINMQVDHVVELQVVPPGEVDGIWDTFINYELLDQSSNSQSGSQLRANIVAERQRLAALTGDPGWLSRPLRFTRVEADSGPGGQRWLAEQIRGGQHLDALEEHQGEP